MKYCIILLFLCTQIAFASDYELGDALDSGAEQFLKDTYDNAVQNEQIETLHKIESELRDAKINGK